MPKYEVEFDYSVREGSSTVVEADDREQAEQYATEYAKETFDDAFDIDVINIKEIEGK